MMINTNKFKEQMPVLNPEERIKTFDEVELGLSDELALKEARRCLNCKNRPCVSGCPVSVNIPEFISALKNNDLKLSYDIIVKTNPLPAICGRVCPQEKQCEARCVRGKTGEPVAVGRLERYVADKNSATDILSEKEKLEFINNTGLSKHKIAVVGSGPAGLTCASELLSFGYNVTVYEALHTPGGVMAYGIPKFRLPDKILKRELEKLMQKGAEIITDCIIGKSFSVDDLFKRGFSAVFISTGAGLPRFMNIPGEGLPGVYCANEFLTRINLMNAHKEKYDTPLIKPRNVLVIGGGNVAMDAARCAKRLGAQSVKVIYRRTQKEMPAREAEILHAKEEGVEFLFLTNPLEFFGEDGKLKGVRCAKMKLQEKDNSGRATAIPEEGQEFEIFADTAIVAVGNLANALIKESDSDIEFDEKGRITLYSGTKTSRPYVYAGGDAVTGAATIISAMGAGKSAAHQIYEDLSSK